MPGQPAPVLRRSARVLPCPLKEPLRSPVDALPALPRCRSRAPGAPRSAGMALPFSQEGEELLLDASPLPSRTLRNLPSDRQLPQPPVAKTCVTWSQLLPASRENEPCESDNVLGALLTKRPLECEPEAQEAQPQPAKRARLYANDAAASEDAVALGYEPGTSALPNKPVPALVFRALRLSHSRSPPLRPLSQAQRVSAHRALRPRGAGRRPNREQRHARAPLLLGRLQDAQQQRDRRAVAGRELRARGALHLLAGGHAASRGRRGGAWRGRAAYGGHRSGGRERRSPPARGREAAQPVKGLWGEQGAPQAPAAAAAVAASLQQPAAADRGRAQQQRQRRLQRRRLRRRRRRRGDAEPQAGEHHNHGCAQLTHARTPGAKL